MYLVTEHCKTLGAEINNYVCNAYIIRSVDVQQVYL